MASGMCSKWWRMRTNLEKTLVSLSVILLLTSVIIIIVGVVSHGDNSHPSAEESNLRLCTTKECIATAGSLIAMADFGADPCDDFYEFACGTYAKTRKNSVSVRYSAMEAMRIKLRNWLESDLGNNISIYDKARDLYQTCMAADGVEVRVAIEEALKQEEIGSWPVLDPYWTDTNFIERTLASLFNIGMNVAFEIRVIRDPQNPKKNMLRISPSHELSLISASGDAKESQALKTYIISTLLELQIPMSMAVEAAEDIVSFESEFIQRIKMADQECGDSTQDDENRVLRDVRVDSVQQIRDYVPELDWNRLMGILYHENKAFKTLKNISIEIYCRKYIRDLTERLVQFSPKTVYNYLGWKFFSPFVQYLGEPFRTLTWTFKSTTPRHVAKVPSVFYPPKWEDCLELLETHLLPVIATAYRQFEVTDNVLDEKIRIASTVRSSLVQVLSSVDWLDDFEKDQLKDKILKSRFRLVMTDVTSRIDEVNQWFSELSVNDQIIPSILNIQKFEAVKKIEAMIDQSQPQWGTASMTSNVLEHDENIIAVHFDKIAQPYLYISQPSYLSFGSFATYLARDLLEYISTFNLMKEVNGNKTIWDIMEIRHKSKNCHDELKINDSLSRNEVMFILRTAMPELNSIEISFNAYKSLNDQDDDLPGLGYTDEQMFFFSYAQSFCEAKRNQDEQSTSWNKDGNTSHHERVNTVLRNNRHFGEAFDCKNGANMKPPLQCTAMGS